MCTRGGEVGIIFVVTSSLKLGSAKCAKDSFCRAPGVSGLSRRKVIFAGTCSSTTGSTPDQTYFVDKVCAPQRKVFAMDPPSEKSEAGHGLVPVPGIRSLEGSVPAVKRLFGEGNCEYNRIKG